jgi:hypothetical protein
MLVIGGFPGSGTRLPALILKNLGYQQGLVNYASDSLHLRNFYDCWLHRKPDSRMLPHLQVAIERQKRSAAPGAFFIKNPRSIYFLEAFDTVSDLKFIHVLRDGRHLQAKWGESLDSWAKINKKVHFYGKLMENRYFLAKYEDLCFSDGISRLLAFLGSEKHPNSLISLLEPAENKNSGIWHPDLEFFGYSR